jgi:uncharacterized protein YcgL (UPF0745 family)
MSLNYCFKKASRIMRRLSPGSREVRDALCRQIQDAERDLNAAAALRLKGCLEDCRGLCCRNLRLEAIFGVPDFVYLLTLEPALHVKIAECIRDEDPLFTSNCLFLERGVGPCLFPPNARPEVCITSFCRGDDALKAEIRRVKKCFWKLGFFLTAPKLSIFHRLLAKTGSGPPD